MYRTAGPIRRGPSHSSRSRRKRNRRPSARPSIAGLSRTGIPSYLGSGRGSVRCPVALSKKRRSLSRTAKE